MINRHNKKPKAKEPIIVNLTMPTPRQNNPQSEYVGLTSPSGAAPTPPAAAPLPKSRIQTYIAIAVCLLSIRLCYEYSKGLAVLALIVFLVVAAYRINVSSQQAADDHELRMRMDRIDREREESEAMVHEAARMMMEINRRHLEKFIITRPGATYEEWISKLHPENVEDGLDGKIIDHRFYVEDSDHRILWNETIGEEREFVPARSNQK